MVPPRSPLGLPDFPTFGHTFTWRLNLREIEIGKEVELTAEGLAAHEALPILITLPGGGTFYGVSNLMQMGESEKQLNWILDWDNICFVLSLNAIQ